MEKLDRRDIRFIAVCLLVIAAGAAVTSVLFRRAFPEASIKFDVDRAGARVVAEKLLAERGRDVAGARFAGEFAVDETAKVYLERELGLEQAGKIYGREAKIWKWRMRWFRSGVKEEEYVTVSPLGELIGFDSVQKEDAPGARLPEAEARAIALRFLDSRRLPASVLKPIEAAPVSRPNRTDWTFVDEKAGVRFADATVRFATTVEGDRVTGFSEFVHVPEAWTRDYQKLRSKNEAAGQIATFALFATLIAMLAVLVRKIVLKDVPWKLVGAFGAIAFVLALLSMINGLPSTLWGYDTASPLSAYLAEQLVRGVLGAVATGAGIAIVVAAAEPIYRERFPRQFSLGGAFSPRGIQTKTFLRSVLLGYALVAFFFAYQAAFYVVAGRLGAWSPAEIPYDDMLNTALPWATVLLIGFLPAVTEEGISRMFSIAFLDRLGAGRVLAVVIPAFIWGFGHSTYPNQPFFIRGLEVGTAGVVMGFVMLRYGVVPLLVWHFTVDALYTALVLLRSGNTYYIVSGALAAGILLLPLFASLVLYARRGGFLSATGLTNGERGFVAEPADVAAAAAAVAGVRPLSRGVRGAAAAAAVVLLSSFFVSTRQSDPPLVADATGRAAAEALARRFLVVNGVDPEPWTSVAYTGTGFPYDPSVRAAKPQDASGIPGFSDDAARYVIAQGGPAAFRKLTERQLPLAYWVVRFFQPEKKEEWKVLIDARRARVVAFVNPVGEDAPAPPPLSGEDARRRAADVAGRLGYPAAEYSVLEVGTEARPRRVDTTVVLEAQPPGIGQARPRLTAVFHGPRLAAFFPSIQVPETFMRDQRKRSSGEVVLTSLRVVAAGALVGLAIILFLRRVREPEFRWRSLTGSAGRGRAARRDGAREHLALDLPPVRHGEADEPLPARRRRVARLRSAGDPARCERGPRAPRRGAAGLGRGAAPQGEPRGRVPARRHRGRRPGRAVAVVPRRLVPGARPLRSGPLAAGEPRQRGSGRGRRLGRGARGLRAGRGGGGRGAGVEEHVLPLDRRPRPRRPRPRRRFAARGAAHGARVHDGAALGRPRGRVDRRVRLRAPARPRRGLGALRPVRARGPRRGRPAGAARPGRRRPGRPCPGPARPLRPGAARGPPRRGAARRRAGAYDPVEWYRLTPLFHRARESDSDRRATAGTAQNSAANSRRRRKCITG